MTGSEPTAVKRSSKAPRPDPAAAEAVDLARAALQEAVEADQVGEYLGCQAEGERVVSHYFACAHPGYVGWHWSVTVSRAPRQRHVAVDEVALVPGPQSLVAPEWVPWNERVRPGDVGAGDLLPALEGDPRLVPGYTGEDGDVSDDATVRPVVDELGLARPRVLSPYGRDLAADRWYAGPHGPRDAIAQEAPAPCSTCGFFLRIDGPLGHMFGVCTNEYSPRDAQVVSLDFGCGAHSEAARSLTGAVAAETETPEPVFDTMRNDDV